MKVVEPIRGFQKKEIPITEFLGFNNTDNAMENEFLEMENMSSRSYPSLVPRLPRETVTSLVKPNGFMYFDGSRYTVDGTSFSKDGVAKGTVADSKKCLVEFNKNILIFPDLLFYDTVGDTFGSFVNGVENPIANPAMDIATVHNNRVFGVKGTNIYASKQGDFKEFNVFDGLNTDSWASDVAGAIEFKCIGAYQNHVVIQSSVNMFELYGYKPSNFQVIETVKQGCDNTVYAEVDGVLYFGNRDGIFAYSGGIPRNIAFNIDMRFSDITLGGDNRYLYINISDGTNHHLFVYDTQLKIMSREDNVNIHSFFKYQNELYVLYENGNMYKYRVDGAAEVIKWSVVTSEFSDFLFTTNSVKKLEIHAEMSATATMDIYIKADNDLNFWHVKSFTADQNRTLLIPIIMYKNAYRMKIEGQGYVKLNAIKRTAQEGGVI